MHPQVIGTSYHSQPPELGEHWGAACFGMYTAHVYIKREIRDKLHCYAWKNGLHLFCKLCSVVTIKTIFVVILKC